MIKSFLITAIITGLCFYILNKMNEQVIEGCERQTTVETSQCIITATE